MKPKSKIYPSLRLYAAADGEIVPPPPLEPDPKGRHRCWGLIMSTPGLWYWGKWIDVTEADLERMVRHQERNLSRGFEPPLLAEHDPKATEARRPGNVGRFEVNTGPGGEQLLWAALTFTRPDAADLIERGEYRFISPRIDTYEDDTGLKEDGVVTEVSLTVDPWQKRFGPRHLFSATTHPPGALMDPEQIVNAINALGDRIAALEQAKPADAPAPVTAPMMGTPPTEEEMSALASVAASAGLNPQAQEAVKLGAKAAGLQTGMAMITALLTATQRPATAEPATAPEQPATPPAAQPPAAPAQPTTLSGQRPAGLEQRQANNQPAPPASTPAANLQERKIQLMAKAKKEANGDSVAALRIYEGLVTAERIFD